MTDGPGRWPVPSGPARACSSTGERPPHTREAAGSTPATPTERGATSWLVAALLLLVLAACGSPDRTVGGDAITALPAPSPVDTPTTAAVIRDAEAIQGLLDDVAAAMRTGDVDRVVEILADPESAFGTRWQERAERMADLPLSTYELELDLTVPDLATEAVRQRHDDPIQVVTVLEHHALEGFDDSGPAEEALFLTLVERGNGWLVVGDDDAEALGLVSVDHLWDLGPVVLSGDGRVQALHHPGTSNVDVVLQQAEAAVDEILQRWPLEWPGRVPVIIPASQEELGELLHVTFDLSNFVAFATATPTGELGEWSLTGARIVVNPDRFLDRAPGDRMATLLHELQHVATRSVAGPYVPNWLEEGLAQVLGEQQSTTGTRLLDAVVDSELALPRNGQFTAGSRDRIFLSYQAAWGFVDWLVDTHGTDQVARFYAALSDDADRPGTDAWHLNDAAIEIFESTFEALVSAWVAAR